MSNVPSGSGSDSGTNGGGGGGGGIAGESLDGEDQEDSSSSSLSRQNDKNVATDELASFRAQWQQELESSSPLHKTTARNESGYEAVTIEEKAKYLFLRGVENEQAGKLYEAIRFYKRAVQLVPDIEFRLYENTKQARQMQDVDVITEDVRDTDSCNDVEDTDDELEDGADLLTRLQRIVNRTHCICTQKHEQKATNISSLPMEIFLYILRWVVSSELDLRSLEMCSRVCRGLYVCSRDPEIWRLACIRIWGLHCGDLSTYGSWREMYIGRPRLHFNGCYISKTTYIRHGENSFQDQFYRPCHIIEYYRYLRFFPEGKVFMLTTPDDPFSSLGHLRTRSPRHQAILVGHYRLTDERVAIALHRQESLSHNRARSRKQNFMHDQTYHLELKIVTYRSQVHAQLVWTGYSVLTHNWMGQEATTTTFDLVPGRFPPFWFSRVKSYNAESEVPLM